VTDINSRLDYLTTTLDALDFAWPRLSGEIQARIDRLTLALISSNNDETRGAIKALRELLALPETLRYERNHINEEMQAA
jgi:hypothetical protein